MERLLNEAKERMSQNEFCVVSEWYTGNPRFQASGSWTKRLMGNPEIQAIPPVPPRMLPLGIHWDGPSWMAVLAVAGCG